MSHPPHILSEFLDTPTHHAYLIVGDSAAHFEKSRLHMREKISAGTFHAADAWSRAYGAISIDDAREIKEIQNTMPVGERRVVLISVETIQHEAQNSLLKLFEEPSVHTVFFVFARTPEIFLPTVLSRFNIVTIASVDAGSNLTEKKDAKSVDIRKFLSSTIAERVEMLEPIIEDKNKNQAEQFLNSLEAALASGKTFKTSPVAPAIFEDIFSARRFLRSRSPSVKMILEHLSGTIPVFSVAKKS
jgi:DNA polymerase III delta prime subunit